MLYIVTVHRVATFLNCPSIYEIVFHCWETHYIRHFYGWDEWSVYKIFSTGSKVLNNFDTSRIVECGRQDWLDNWVHSETWSYLYRRATMVEEQGDLEDQLAKVLNKDKEIREHKDDMKVIEDLGAQMEEALILDNKYVLFLYFTFFPLFHRSLGLSRNVSLWEDL